MDCINRTRIEKTVSEYLITKVLTSHIWLAFFYGIFLFLYEIKFLRNIVPVVHPALIAWACMLILYDAVVRKIWSRIPFAPILALFAVSAGITVMLSIKLGPVAGIKSWIMTILPLGAFLPTCLIASEKEREKAIMCSMSGAAIVMFFASLAALVLYSLQFSRYVTFAGVRELVGMRYYVPDDPTTGLLVYGLNVDTNHAAAYSILFAAYGIALFICGKKNTFDIKWQNKTAKIFGLASAIVQISYFPLTNSRGGWLSLGIALALVAFLYSFCYRYSGSGKKRWLASVLFTVISASAVIGGLLLVRCAVTKLPDIVNVDTSEYQSSEERTEGDMTVEYFDDDNVSFSKNQTSKDGMRLTIWKEAIQLFAKRPIFGTATCNNRLYTLIYEIQSVRLKYGAAIHNSYLDLLVDYGVTGFVLLLGFFVMCAVTVLRGCFAMCCEKNIVWYLSVFLVSTTVCAAMTLSCVFINTTAMYFVMLNSVSYLIACEKKN